MKKWIVLVIAAMLLLSLTGCDAVQDTLADVGLIAGNDSESVTDEELYSGLDYLIGNPDGTSYLPGTFTFTAKILSEPEDVTFDDDDNVYQYQQACISRNDEDSFYLNVTALEERPQAESIVHITGSVDGTVYWTEENEQIIVLDILAEKIESFSAPEPEVSEGPAVAVHTSSSSGEYTFLGAHRSASVMDGDNLVVYFEFENTGDSEAAPTLEKFYFWHGEAQVEPSGWEPEEVRADALHANPIGIADKTYAGKTTLYYMTLGVNPDAADGDPIYIVMYNDDFQITADIAVPVAASLEAME